MSVCPSHSGCGQALPGTPQWRTSPSSLVGLGGACISDPLEGTAVYQSERAHGPWHGGVPWPQRSCCHLERWLPSFQDPAFSPGSVEGGGWVGMWCFPWFMPRSCFLVTHSGDSEGQGLSFSLMNTTAFQW